MNTRKQQSSETYYGHVASALTYSISAPPVVLCTLLGEKRYRHNELAFSPEDFERNFTLESISSMIPATSLPDFGSWRRVARISVVFRRRGSKLASESRCPRCGHLSQKSMVNMRCFKCGLEFTLCMTAR